MSTGKKRVIFYDCDGDEKVWTVPEPESIPGSKLELPSPQPAQL
jgi:hypothetical protein